MLGCIYKVSVLVLYLVIQCLGEDYCEKNLCFFGTTHIACPLNESFGDACSKNASVVQINQDDINTVIKAHNLVRQKWASGKAKFPNKACRMASVEWDEDLAKLAVLNAKGCIMKHDECHNTAKFRLSGQNLFNAGFWQSNGKDMSMTTKDLFEIAVQMWAGEERDVTADNLKAYPENSPAVVGHLTVLINEKSYAVGCAIVNYEAEEYNRYNMACNYAYTNVIGHSVYSVCPEAGSECPKGLSSLYPPLCA
ncbi:antigen 5 like allergen Cul n 1 [Drosophila elegans]|uniref:antigen 5 like allergen Cul n 1 n=1 Tax=Drosophila elegans TaxID=30023 RepID=UPI0007E7C5BC|nr:antigen 5 like allergen Cul n 1 [Drosophila elegans]